MISLSLATHAHTPQVLSIYSGIILHSHTSFEYEVPSQMEMENRITSVLNRYPWLVLLEQDQVAGYAYATQLRYRQAYDWSAELSIYIHPDFQNRGLARYLYNALMEILKLQQVHRVFGVIALPNEPSIKLHEKLGFRKVGELPHVGFKFEKWHTVAFYLKELNLNKTPEPFIAFNKIDRNRVGEVLNNYSRQLP